jgi:hypothetical protein
VEAEDCGNEEIMKEEGRFLAVIVFCTAFAGCAPSVMMNPEYKSTVFAGRNLNVAIEGGIVIDYEGNMDNEFPREGRNEKIQAFLCSTAAKILKDSTVFRSVKAVPIGCGSFKSTALEVNRMPEGFYVDVPEYVCYNPPDSGDLWLFIEQPLVQSKVHVQVTVIAPTPIVAAFPTKPFTISGKFLFWDAARKKPIAWGNASGTYETGLGVTMTHWLLATNDLVTQMVNGMPFKRKVHWNFLKAAYE